VSGATVAIDAMGCQIDVAEKIVEKEADYCLVLKRNPKSLYEGERCILKIFKQNSNKELL